MYHFWDLPIFEGVGQHFFEQSNSLGCAIPVNHLSFRQEPAQRLRNNPAMEAIYFCSAGSKQRIYGERVKSGKSSLLTKCRAGWRGWAHWWPAVCIWKQIISKIGMYFFWPAEVLQIKSLRIPPVLHVFCNNSQQDDPCKNYQRISIDMVRGGWITITSLLIL